MTRPAAWLHVPPGFSAAASAGPHGGSWSGSVKGWTVNSKMTHEMETDSSVALATSGTAKDSLAWKPSTELQR